MLLCLYARTPQPVVVQLRQRRLRLELVFGRILHHGRRLARIFDSRRHLT